MAKVLCGLATLFDGLLSSYLDIPRSSLDTKTSPALRVLHCSHIYRIFLANALPNAILSKFALFARNSEAFGSICKHSEAFGENFESLRKLGTCS